VVVRSSILAPIAGQVVQREVTLGELVNAERDALLVLADLSTLWVLADVPEGRMSAVRVGAEARVKVAGSDRPLAGKVTYVAPSLDAETRTVSVRIELPHHSSLRPGMFARAEIVAAADGGEPVVAVPEASIQTIEGRPSVFVPVKGEAGAFAVRAVKVGPATGGFVPVFEGLAEGEPVVTGGTFILKAELGKSGAGHEH
jgi:cobalt-zinc-cadmium efflux system membrane fusion protein